MLLHIYLWLSMVSVIWCLTYMVKDHSDGEKGTELTTLSNWQQGFFVCTFPQTGYHIPKTGFKP